MKNLGRVLCFGMFLLLILLTYVDAVTAAVKELPVPPTYTLSGTPTRIEQEPLRQHSFTADKRNTNGYIESTVTYSYVGMTQPAAMVDQAYEETIAKDVRGEEKRLQGNPNYLGRTTLGGGTLLIVKRPPPPDAMIGKPVPDRFDASFYEKLGRGMLVIKISGVEGGEGKIRELVDYMRQYTDVCL